jgi:hypothetical protein
VDTAATAELRQQMRTRRKWDEVPVYTRGDALAAD